MSRYENMGQGLVETKVAKLKPGKRGLTVLGLSTILVCLTSFLMFTSCVSDKINGQLFELKEEVLGDVEVSELYVIDADGDNATRLQAVGVKPRWSPNGEKIAFVHYEQDVATTSTITEIRTVNADGSSQLTLFKASWPDSARMGYGAFWSHDGKQIAFYIWHEGRQKIAVMNTDGSEFKILEQLSQPFLGIPGYSPDGKKQIITTETQEIYVIQLDSEERTLVGMGGGAFLGEARSATWSNDSKQIVFSNIDDVICVVNADGSGLTDLGRKGHAPAMSPDGSKIVFVVTEWTLDPRTHGPDNLYLMNSDGSNCVRLTSSPTDEGSPAWSPDGKKIVFIVSPESRGIFSSASD